jgi:hypothetical protein
MQIKKLFIKYANILVLKVCRELQFSGNNLCFGGYSSNPVFCPHGY